MWYNYVFGFTDEPICRLVHDDNSQNLATVRRMNQLAQFTLLHDRSGHSCDDTIESLHKHLEDCPKVKRNPFFRCPACMQNKAKHRHFNSTAGQQDPVTKQKGTSAQEEPTNPQDVPEETLDPYDTMLPDDADLQPGQMFQIDFGFVRGSGSPKQTMRDIESLVSTA